MSLLNKAYEIQCMKVQEFEIADRLTNMNMNQEMHMSNEDRMFMSPVRPQSAPAMTVVGGRFVPSTNKSFPLNGQQLQMQLDELTSAMTDMTVQTDTMEMPCNQAYNQYIHERCCTNNEDSNPFSQEEKRRDPVYLSMAAHITTIAPEHDHSEVALAEQMEKHQFLLSFLEHHGISHEQFAAQQQLIEEEIEKQYAAHKARENEHRQQQIIAEIQAVVIPNSSYESSMPSNGVPRLLKRPDIMPMQKCTMWT